MAQNFIKDKLASMPMGNYVAVARGHDLVVIRVMGRGNMLNAPALQEFAEEQRKAGYTKFLFDFERCAGLDSTFMGVMVGMHSAGDSGRWPAAGPPALVPEDQPKNSGSPDETSELTPMSPEEALAALSSQGLGPPLQKAPTPPTTVSAVNCSREIQNLLAMLGVDKFVKVRGACDLSKLETTILPEKAISPLERQELIFKAHEQLVEIDRRNEAEFGDLLKALAEELGKK